MIIEHCTLCPRNCGTKRTAQNGVGFCGMGADPVVANAALYFGEEPCVSGTRGSGAVFFTGCSLQCVFCQNYEISTERKFGKTVTPEKLADIFKNLAAQGAHNINLVTATHFVPAVVKALSIWKPSIPVIYNCSGYESISTLKMLEGLVDIYLTDLKYSDTALAKIYSKAPNYVEIAQSAILEMVRQTGSAVYDNDLIMQSGTIVRHLILPGHTRDSMVVLDWISRHLPKGVPVSLMAQYTPCGKAENFPEINRRITKREYQKVQDYLFTLDLDGYVQEMDSAGKKYIPPFHNLDGVPAD